MMTTHHPPSSHITPSPNSHVTDSNDARVPGADRIKGLSTSLDGKGYINIQFVDGRPDMTALPLDAGTGTQYRPEYVNIPISSTSHTSTAVSSKVEGERKFGNGSFDSHLHQQQQQSLTVLEEESHVPLPKQRSDTHVPTGRNKRYLPPRQVPECAQCNDLLERLSLWELGVSGLTRQYSQILAQLNHAHDAATIIECKMKEEWERQKGTEERGRGRSGEEGEGGVRIPVKSPRRKTILSSVDESVAHSTTLADQMYPREGSNYGEPLPQLPTEYTAQFAELMASLGRAIDLCQQLAASSFKTQASGLFRKNFKKKSIQRQESTPLSLPQEMGKGGSPWRPEKKCRKRGVLIRRETEPVLSTSTSEMSEEEEEEEGERGERNPVRIMLKHPSKTSLSRSKTHYVPNKEPSSRSSIAGDLFNGGDRETGPVRSHMMSLIAEDEARRVTRGEGEGERERSSSYVILGSPESDEGDYSLLSNCASTFSDTDVKQVMTKIAVLEEERLKLLETVDQIQSDNQRVRLSLYETLGDLESKDMLLTVAMQDLTIATDEIKRVAGLRAQLDTMEDERENILQKLNNLEDESSAVKVSLIQLLQEKSATNKTLSLENWRLRQTVKQGGEGEDTTLTRTDSRSSTHDYMREDDLSNYVHKQGFLVKQGRRVKNWKRRLFVLDSNGLSYYKTEQPIQKVSLSNIKKIQVTHNHSALPHMFEVHTPERVFFLSAPSSDEMQSWIGMLQTLKQYARHSPPATKEGEPVSSTTPHRTVSTNAVLHQVTMENGDAVTGGKAWRSTSVPTTAGMSVLGDQVGGTSSNGTVFHKRLTTAHRVGSRPRSHAFTMTKHESYDEAIPDSSRPMSVMITADSRTTGTEWKRDQSTITEDPSYQNKVLSRSHPSTGTQFLTPTIILET